MPIQKETKLNTGANMPLIGLGTFLTRIPERRHRLISLDLPRDVEVEPWGG
jgi:hypothetical protein